MATNEASSASMGTNDASGGVTVVAQPDPPTAAVTQPSTATLHPLAAQAPAIASDVPRALQESSGGGHSNEAQAAPATPAQSKDALDLSGSEAFARRASLSAQRHEHPAAGAHQQQQPGSTQNQPAPDWLQPGKPRQQQQQQQQQRQKARRKGKGGNAGLTGCKDSTCGNTANSSCTHQCCGAHCPGPCPAPRHPKTNE